MSDVNRTVRVLLAVAASGIPAAFLWWALARPAQWMATDRGLILNEVNARGQFQVVAVFTVIGAVIGLVAGWLTHRLTRPATWRVALGVAAAASVASLVCWRLGVRLGPGAVEDASGLEAGDMVPAPLTVDSIPSFLVWPLAAVLTYTLSLYLSNDGVDREAEEFADFADESDLSERSQP